jgi:hypothetical protein
MAEPTLVVAVVVQEVAAAQDRLVVDLPHRIAPVEMQVETLVVVAVVVLTDLDLVVMVDPVW